MEQKYKQAFSRVKASPEKIQEVINMTENRKPRRIIRRFLVTAAIMALAVLTAMGANAASGGELFARIVSYVKYEKDGEYVAEMQVEIDDGALTDGSMGEFQIVGGEDGKAIMSYTDENGRKVTKEIDLDQVLNELDLSGQVQSQLESQTK